MVKSLSYESTILRNEVLKRICILIEKLDRVRELKTTISYTKKSYCEIRYGYRTISISLSIPKQINDIDYEELALVCIASLEKRPWMSIVLSSIMVVVAVIIMFLQLSFSSYLRNLAILIAIAMSIDYVFKAMRYFSRKRFVKKYRDRIAIVKQIDAGINESLELVSKLIKYVVMQAKQKNVSRFSIKQTELVSTLSYRRFKEFFCRYIA